jgi:hypothetical protein
MTFGINGLPDVKNGRYLTIFVTLHSVPAIKKDPRGSFFTSKADGAVEVSRTPDLLITNQLLYQLSYNGSCSPKYKALTVGLPTNPAVNQLTPKTYAVRHSYCTCHIQAKNIFCISVLREKSF